MSEPAGPEASGKEGEVPPAPAPAETAAPAPPLGPLPASERALWLEVAAVLAVSVLPWFCSAVASVVERLPPQPYWLDSLYLTWTNLCVIFVVLYLIHRSGENWATFGLSRPQAGDVGIALALVMADWALWYRFSSLLPNDSADGERFFRGPGSAAERLMMVVKYLTVGFVEELVTRAYLITRLERLLQSGWQALLWSSLAFGSFHVYYGVDATLLYFFLFGLVFGGFYLLIRRLWPFALAHALINMSIDLQRAAG
jgi:membrane protease YdiL (CAAX protease family)